MTRELVMVKMLLVAILVRDLRILRVIERLLMVNLHLNVLLRIRVIIWKVLTWLRIRKNRFVILIR